MERSRADAYEFLTIALEMGEALMGCGAEVNRIEDTISRMGMAYGAIEMNVFVITTSIVVTMELSEGNSVTLTRRISSPGGTDFRKLSRINDVSRAFCNEVMPLDVLKAEFVKATRPTTKPIRLYIGSAVAAGAFAVFFGGTVWDGLIAALFGILICLFQRKLQPVSPNTIVYNIVSSFVVGLGVCLFAKLIPILNIDKIMIGDIMLLIPGVAMTNAIRDILIGDTMSGTMRLIESVMWAGALAAGFIMAFWIVW
ncbi:MAG: threonine/serine exporter family protein [Oscillospiraceae bacterium]|nr:threonine/serine exporter family protein [Candidatus Limimonas coprohippi]MCQ2487854.1 threonine/serine exporter family protein [Clostridia bacterium]